MSGTTLQAHCPLLVTTEPKLDEVTCTSLYCCGTSHQTARHDNIVRQKQGGTDGLTGDVHLPGAVLVRRTRAAATHDRINPHLHRVPFGRAMIVPPEQMQRAVDGEHAYLPLP